MQLKTHLIIKETIEFVMRDNALDIQLSRKLLSYALANMFGRYKLRQGSHFLIR